MNILFLTTGCFESIEQHSLYPDLLLKFRDSGHIVYSVSTYERRIGKETEYITQNRHHALRVKVGNLTKCGTIEKGIATVLIEKQYKKAIKKYMSDVKFDLILYSTPPITLVKVIEYLKKRDMAKTYLLLKDIFPQNAVDLGMMQMTGIKGFLYKYFRKKEKKLYAVSDNIGCMSQANVDYVLKHNPEILKEKVEICPNCIEVRDLRLSEQERMDMRDKYGIPKEKKVFVYGGNLGKPQDVSFIISCLKKCAELTDAYFVVAGSGTDRYLLERYVKKEKPSHVKLFDYIPKDEYDRMIACCDVGLIFLDHRFTIPNFPSRLLSYMQAGLPVLACTDSSTDIGNVIVNGGIGWWCESNDVEHFLKCIKTVVDTLPMDNSAIFEYVSEHYSAIEGARIIMSSIHKCGKNDL